MYNHSVTQQASLMHTLHPTVTDAAHPIPLWIWLGVTWLEAQPGLTHCTAKSMYLPRVVLQYKTSIPPPRFKPQIPTKAFGAHRCCCCAYKAEVSFVQGTQLWSPGKGPVEPQGCTIWVPLSICGATRLHTLGPPSSQSETKNTNTHPGLSCKGSHDGVVQQVNDFSTAQLCTR